MNIPNIPNPFIQQQGQTYWLELFVQWPGDGYGYNEPVGWKTTRQNTRIDAACVRMGPLGTEFQDGQQIQNATWYPAGPEFWPQPSPPPQPTGSLRRVGSIMAFVITPEPSTFVLLGVGAISLLAYAWRRRKVTAQAYRCREEKPRLPRESCRATWYED